MANKPKLSEKLRIAEGCIDSILEVMYPEGDLDHEWDAETIELVAEVLSNFGFGPEED